MNAPNINDRACAIIGGMKLMPVGWLPKFEFKGPVILRESFPHVSNKFREDFNGAMIEMFGGSKTRSFLVSQVYGAIYANPENIAMLLISKEAR